MDTQPKKSDKKGGLGTSLELSLFDENIRTTTHQQLLHSSTSRSDTSPSYMAIYPHASASISDYNGGDCLYGPSFSDCL